jgi:type IV pilus assembly protein PilB
MARSFRAVVFSANGDSTSIALADELLRTEVDALLGAIGGIVQFYLAPASQIQRLLDKQHRATDSIAELVKSFESIEIMRRGAIDESNDAAVSEDAPVVQVVARILTQAVRDRASDIHIEPKKNEVRVRFRIDGVLTTVLELPVVMGPSLVSRIKVMAQMNIVERRRPQDGQFGAEVDGQGVDVRVATIATIWGEHCSMRILEKSRSVMTLADLGMPHDTYEKFIRVVRSPSGMVLCTGPTGSGKTTTLYAVLSEVVDGTRNIMTIEDPVEYVLPSISQIQTNDQAGLSFATGLRSILRQDPDVILVGEIRDVETARIAVQSALTGHAVLSSVHATDAVSALHRFLDMGIESFLISSSITGIVGQRLLRLMCSHCKVAYQPTAEELELYKSSGLPAKKTFYVGEGCNFCSGTGFHGRIGVYEFLPITSEIKRLVAAFAPQDQLQEMAEKEGMRTLRQEAYRLVERDLTTISEVLRSTYTI